MGVYNHDFLHVSIVGSVAIPPTAMTNMPPPHWLATTAAYKAAIKGKCQ